MGGSGMFNLLCSTVNIVKIESTVDYNLFIFIFFIEIVPSLQPLSNYSTYSTSSTKYDNGRKMMDIIKKIKTTSTAISIKYIK